MYNIAYRHIVEVTSSTHRWWQICRVIYKNWRKICLPTLQNPNNTQKQKAKEKEERQKRSEAKCNANCKEKNCGHCNKLGFLHKFSAIPDTFRQFFSQSYSRRFQKYDFHYLCADCINNANNARLKVSDRIANHYGIQIYDPPNKKNEKHSSLQQMLQSLEEDDQIVKNFSLPKQTRDTYEKVILLLFTACVFACLGLQSYSC
jgi:hypothetical protein